MRKTLIASLLSVVVAAPAMAADSPHTFSGNISFASSYFYRGITQTDYKPALQGGLDYSHSSGFYLGAWGSNISWLPGKSSLETDIYGGFKFDAGPVGIDVGVLSYIYPGTDDLEPSPNTVEAYVGATWKGITAKYSYSTTDLFGVPNSDGSYYGELNAGFEIGGGFTLVGHVGRQYFANKSATSYNDVKIGVTKEYAGVTWGIAAIDTDITKPRALFTASKSF